jgi:RimJ/RimL family protein N-acetyltransferase
MNMLASIVIRPIRSDDVGRLRTFLRGLSAETRYMRFHQLVTDFTDAQWRYLTCVDGRDHAALVAVSDRKIVGVSRYIRDRERPDVAEVAFVVSDELQRRGVGRRLRDRLVVIARANGIRSFEAFVKPNNFRIRRLLSGGGLALVSRSSDMLEATFDDCDSAAE